MLGPYRLAVPAPLARLLAARPLPGLLLVAVLALDVGLASMPFHPLTALDEAAHLATSALVLLAVAGAGRLRAAPVLAGCTLLGSVAIDVDHVPLYLGVPHVADGGRPYTHCLLTAVVLLGLAALSRRHRVVWAGLGLGVCLHFVRDVATGPGLQPWEPFTGDVVRLPYAAYAVVLAVLAAAATGRALRTGAAGGRAAAAR